MFLRDGNKYEMTHRRIVNMTQNRQVPMMISLPPEVRDKLRILAAEQNMRNPMRVTAAATIAREYILEGIERIERMEEKLQPSNALSENSGLLVDP
jgi:hypothetical protein